MTIVRNFTGHVRSMNHFDIPNLALFLIKHFFQLGHVVYADITQVLEAFTYVFRAFQICISVGVFMMV